MGGHRRALGKLVRARLVSGGEARDTQTALYRRTEAELTAVTFEAATGKVHKQLVDCGCTREMVGREYCRRHNLKTKRLARAVTLKYMDGSYGTPITHATWQKIRIPGANGSRTFTIKYLVADIPEGMVLGFTWLQYANPDINWQRRAFRWRTPETVLKLRKARQRIIQGAIEANEPPAWVKTEFADVITPRKWDGELPPHRPGLDYELKLRPGFKPHREPNRSFSPKERRAFSELADQETAAGRWRLSNSPQAVQMLWAAKAGGAKRPCTDYRRLNKWIVDDAFPIPVIKDLMTDVAGKHYLTSLDLPRAYNEIRIKDHATEDLLAFICNNRLYAPTVMQFGSKTAVAHFQRFITHVLGNVIGKGCYAYLDNIIIYAQTLEEHDKILKEVLQKLRQAKLSLQPAKCEWQKQEVQFCGFLVSRHGVRMDPEKVRAIQEWEPPRAGGALGKTKVREFIGFCNFYREGIKDFSAIAAPLTSLTSPNTPWKWGQQEEASWAMLKTAVLAAPVRAAYDERLPIEVHTDASDEGIAATIEHRYHCGHTRPIAFYSRKLGPAERNYAVHDKELLAIVKTFEHFRSWLHGAPEPVKVWSDHKALTHFLDTTKLTQRHARWAELLGEFRFQIQHIAGRANRAADALSRKDWTGNPAPAVTPLQAKHFATLGN